MSMLSASKVLPDVAQDFVAEIAIATEHLSVLPPAKRDWTLALVHTSCDLFLDKFGGMLPEWEEAVPTKRA